MRHDARGEVKKKTSNVPTISMGSTTTTEVLVGQNCWCFVRNPGKLTSWGTCSWNLISLHGLFSHHPNGGISTTTTAPTFQGTKHHQTPETGGVGAEKPTYSLKLTQVCTWKIGQVSQKECHLNQPSIFRIELSASGRVSLRHQHENKLTTEKNSGYKLSSCPPFPPVSNEGFWHCDSLKM